MKQMFQCKVYTFGTNSRCPFNRDVYLIKTVIRHLKSSACACKKYYARDVQNKDGIDFLVLSTEWFLGGN